MDQRRKGRAFLEGGLWVPLEVAAPLSQSLQLLRGWLNAQRQVDPTVAVLVHLEVLKLKQTVVAGIFHHRLVPVDHWKHAVLEIQCLTNWLAATR
jgi:hypothetical protein